ncbi:spermidine synthase [Kitasatospora camelliae]|uniref:Spermidine synthase n=1 Tax=Kitasatospora camelliae TaxID=3156397 RepID=A0AAU8JW31_9ACTN
MINHSAGPPARPGLDGPGTSSPAAESGASAIRPRGPDAIRRTGLRARLARPLVLLAAFVCAACGLVYELELVALGGYLLGDSVTQTSVVLSVMVFAMGVGSLLAKRLTPRPVTSFALVECALALVGGLSVLVLYSGWAWLSEHRATTAGLVGLTFLIGLLIGAEIPLLMTLIQRIRREHPGKAVADLFAADYVGALIGGLAFPFLLLPSLGQAAGALLTGAVNAVAGAAVVLWLFREEPRPRARALLWAGCGLVLVLLAAAAACTGAIERAARQALYGAQLRFAAHSRFQEIVLTGGTVPPGPRAPGQRPAPLRLYLDGRLTVCGADEYREHEALVHPALAQGPSGRVLLLGGDGLALREALLHPSVREVLVVEPDPVLSGLARRDPALAALGGHGFDDPRVRVVNADPLDWLRRPGPEFDVVLSDLHGETSGGKYLSREFYALAAGRLAPDGRLAVRTGPVGRRLWATESGLRAAGLRTVPYQGAAGAPGCAAGAQPAFVLAGRADPVLGLAADTPLPQSLTAATLRASADRIAALRPSRLPPPHSLLG